MAGICAGRRAAGTSTDIVFLTRDGTVQTRKMLSSSLIEHGQLDRG